MSPDSSLHYCRLSCPATCYLSYPFSSSASSPVVTRHLFGCPNLNWYSPASPQCSSCRLALRPRWHPPQFPLHYCFVVFLFPSAFSSYYESAWTCSQGAKRYGFSLCKRNCNYEFQLVCGATRIVGNRCTCQSMGSIADLWSLIIGKLAVDVFSSFLVALSFYEPAHVLVSRSML